MPEITEIEDFKFKNIKADLPFDTVNLIYHILDLNVTGSSQGCDGNNDGSNVQVDPKATLSLHTVAPQAPHANIAVHTVSAGNNEPEAEADIGVVNLEKIVKSHGKKRGSGRRRKTRQNHHG